MRTRWGGLRSCLLLLILPLLAPAVMFSQTTAQAPPLPPPAGDVVNVSTEPQLQQAVHNLHSGTTIVIAPGVYQLTSTLWVDGALTDVGIVGATSNRDDVVLAGPGMSRASYGLVPYGIWAGDGVRGLTIANLTVKGVYYDAILFTNSAQAPRVYNVHIVDSGAPAVRALRDANGVAVDGGAVEYSLVEYTTTAPDANTPAIELVGGTGWRISHSAFRNIVGPQRQTGQPAVLAWNGASGTVVEASSFTNTSQAVGFGSQAGGDHSGGIIRNNFIFRSVDQPGDAGIRINGSPSTQVLNNTVYLSGTFATSIDYRLAAAHDVVVENNLVDGAIVAEDGATGTESNNLTGARADLFVDAVHGDLHLTRSAVTAIDHGVTVEGVIDDADGRLRPSGQAYDIGAHEFGAVLTTAGTNRYIAGRITTDSGNNGLDGVTVTLSGGRSASVTTQWNGVYTFTNLADGADYTVTPSRNGYKFSPSSLAFHALAASVFTANFVATTAPSGPSGPTSPMSVQLMSPNEGATFNQGATITFIAYASGSHVSRVDFYAGSQVVASDTNSPYTGQWKNVASGTYVVRAVAVDNGGSTVSSSSETIKVGSGSTTTPPTTTPPPTTVTPTVSITTPSNGSSYTSPATIGLSASASITTSSVGGIRALASTASITKVDFYAGSTLVGSDSTPPYNVAWTNVTGGTYSIKAVATTSTGTTAQSNPITVTVTQPAVVPMTVSLTSPTGGSYTAPATIPLGANPSGGTGGVAKVDFYAGSTLVGTDSSSPYSVSWVNVSAGTYSITAVATDATGATVTSTPVVVSVAAAPTAPPPVPAGGHGARITSLKEVCSFNVPDGSFGSPSGAGFNYGGIGLAFNPAKGTLFLVGYDEWTAEMTIPACGDTASVVTDFADATEGRLNQIGSGGQNQIGGELVYNGNLIVTGFVYYDATGAQTLSHFVRPADLTVKGKVVGPSRAGSLGAGWYSGYMAAIPPDWQAALGGPALTGNCCLSIISRTSYGPSISSFDPANIGNATRLLGYDTNHETLGAWGASGANPVYNGTVRIAGAVFPNGTSTVLFFGKTGTGNYCYGEAAACGDPSNNYKGEHAYPYEAYVWAYDANDLAAVKAGTKNPYDVKPYSTWQLPGFSTAVDFTGSAAYDAATGRIFVVEQRGNGTLPTIHIYNAVQ